jgi:AcrR family transcriptional regulator
VIAGREEAVVSNPLFDTLFRPTTGDAARPMTRVPNAVSAAPVRAKGVHTRAGNAMTRTRTALLAGAARAVEASGTKITMAQVATSSGVAKATLYNHFRTRDAVLAALVMAQVQAVADAQADKPLEAALVDAATAIATNPVRRGLARLEPAALAALAVRDDSAEAWQYARAAVAAVLAAAGRGGTDTVLRWLASFVVNPADMASIQRDAAVLLAGLPTVVAVEAGGTAGDAAAS